MKAFRREEYEANPKICPNCKKKIPWSGNNTLRVKTCSQKCRSELSFKTNKKLYGNKKCEHCGRNVIKSNRHKWCYHKKIRFCSLTCARLFVYQKHQGEYERNLQHCDTCGKKIAYHSFKRNRRRRNREKNGLYCSQKCAYQKRRERFNHLNAQCRNCGKQFRHTTRGDKRECCSKKCYGALCKQQRTEKWLAGKSNPKSVKKYMWRALFQLRGGKCEKCGGCEINPYSGLLLIDLDHIDGNRKNNRPLNLRFLCKQCHAKTPTYMHLNNKNWNKNRLPKTN